MRQISYQQISGNLIDRIARQWFLITAGTPEACNTMTANWGGVGYLWMKPVVYLWVRPERYTFEFLERYGTFTIAFLPESRREALALCGQLSGRSHDKIKEADLTVAATPDGNVTFAEAELTLECRKLYCQDMNPAGFVDRTPKEKWYGPGVGGFHRLYVGEITHVWEA